MSRATAPVIAHVVLAMVAVVAMVGAAASAAGDAPRAQVVAGRPKLRDFAAAGIDSRYVLSDRVVEHERSVVARVAAITTARLAADPAGDAIARASCIGDLVAWIRGRPESERDSALARVLAERKDLTADGREALGEWMRVASLRDPEWTPDDDHGDDGLWQPDSLEFDSDLGIPGGDSDGMRFRQGAALYFADLATIKAHERDFAHYPDRAGTTYRSIGLVADSTRFLEIEGQGAVLAYHVVFISDLPFPFGEYTCDLAVMDRRDAKGRLRCDIHSASEDFHWMAGCDVYLPLRSSDGKLVAWVIARIFGFDLDDVPDADSDRATALRGSLLNLKRESERSTAEWRARPVDESTEITRVLEEWK